MVDNNRFIISGGGTGGHIYPALSIANKIQESFSNSEIKFVGAKGRMEMNIVPRHGYNIEGLWISGLQRSFSIKNLLLPFKLTVSFIHSLFIIIKFNPKFVIGTGGFASFPIVFISSLLRIPTLIQEQNSLPGISNRLLSSYANYISVGYDKMEKYFPSKKLFLTGNPIRESISKSNSSVNIKKKLNIEDNKIIISIFGGSLGSDKINKTKAAGGRVIAVGTTVLRALESSIKGDKIQPYSGNTNIFISPGYKVRSSDYLLTNFHLPKSTLFILTCAYAGIEKMHHAYKHAIEEGYRFYSLGDACLIKKANQ